MSFNNDNTNTFTDAGRTGQRKDNFSNDSAQFSGDNQAPGRDWGDQQKTMGAGRQGYNDNEFSSTGAGNPAYQGGTTDFNTPGTGGDFGNTGRHAGQQFDPRAGGRSDEHTTHRQGQDWNTTGTNVSAATGDRRDHIGGNTTTGGFERHRDADNYGTTATGVSDRHHDTDTHGSTAVGGKPTMGEKLMGSMEKMAGKMTGKPAMAERGQERKEGANF